MKALITCLILLAFFKSNSQIHKVDSSLKNPLQDKSIIKKDGQITVVGQNEFLSNMPTYYFKEKPKYDTVRVLVAYADTVKDGRLSFVRYGDTKSNEYIMGNAFLWQFVYSVRELGEHITGWGDDGFFKFQVKKHIKYLTEDKKSIPSSWVVLIEKSL